MILADTDVLIDSLRGREPAVGLVAEAIRAGVLATTVISVFELLSGSRSESERAACEGLLAAARVLPLDPAAAETAATVRRGLEETGQGIGLADYLIAGICLDGSAELMTRNRRHFERVPGLRLVEL